MKHSSPISNFWLVMASCCLFALSAFYITLQAQNTSEAIQEVQSQKKEAEKEITEHQNKLTDNEKLVTEGLAELRRIDEEIEVSESEIATVQNQLDEINENIFDIEFDIVGYEDDLKYLRDEYLKAVKKMRVARKKNSGLAFIFSSGSFNEARRRLRYMNEFSNWKDRRTSEIAGTMLTLENRRGELQQAENDAKIVLRRQEIIKEKLSGQKIRQQATVDELKANSDALKSKIAKRQADAITLANRISALIAEQQAKDAEAKRKAEEQRIAEEKRKAEEKRLAEEKLKEEEKATAENKADKKSTADKQPTEDKQVAQQPPTSKTEEKRSDNVAHRRRRAKPTEETTSGTMETFDDDNEEVTVAMESGGFEGMKGSLPRPVGGSFRIVSAFGSHPISPELPDIKEENFGIDAHVDTGATACAVYDGEVIHVYDPTMVSGYRNIVVVKHGDYITLYANIETLNVKTGDKVAMGQTIGTVGSDFDDPSHGRIHFEVWKNQTRLDPATWIR